MEILACGQKVFEQLEKRTKSLLRHMSFYWRIIVGAKEPTGILAYGQTIFEQICHGKKTKSLLRHLNDNVCARTLNGLNEVIVYDEVKKLYFEFEKMFDKKCIRKEIKKEDFMKLIDWYLIANELDYVIHGYFGYNVGMRMESFASTAKREDICVVKNYLNELEKYAVGVEFRGFVVGYFSTPLEQYLKYAREDKDWVYESLGHFYKEGLRGCAQDYAEAAKWYTKAVEKNRWPSAHSCHSLGDLYASGLGVKQDDKQAVHWYYKAAEQGDVEARYKLGNMYSSGRGVTQDDVQAVHWYYMAAEAELPEAQYELGKMCASGRGVAQAAFDHASSAYGKTYTFGRGVGLSAFDHASSAYGKMYTFGHDVAQGDEEAIKWYLKAAEGGVGFAPAQYELGNMYASGRGVARDDEQALYWYNRAAEQGLAEAKDKLGQ